MSTNKSREPAKSSATEVSASAEPSKPLTNVRVQLTGTDGNAFAILGRVSRSLQQGGYAHLVEPFYNEATAGDYDHLLQTCMKYVEVD